MALTICLVLIFVLSIVCALTSGRNLLEHLRNENRSVLCLGDSLTHGMIPLGPRNKILHKPYSIRLSALLNNNAMLGSSASGTKLVEVHERGIDGERTADMLIRLQSILPELGNVGLVIILGGSNDICNPAVANSTIIKNIKAMHATVHQFNTNSPAYTIALTVPDLSPWIRGDTVITEKYTSVNAGIRDLQQALRLHAVGLLEMENRWTPQDGHRKYWSADNVHFSEVGYQSIGEHLYMIMRDTRLDD